MAELTEAAESDDRKTTLEALRDKLARTIDAADPEKVALGPLSKQLRDVLLELEALRAPAEVSRLDDLAARRAQRLPDAASQ